MQPAHADGRGAPRLSLGDLMHNFCMALQATGTTLHLVFSAMLRTTPFSLGSSSNPKANLRLALLHKPFPSSCIV